MKNKNKRSLISYLYRPAFGYLFTSLSLLIFTLVATAYFTATLLKIHSFEKDLDALSNISKLTTNELSVAKNLMLTSNALYPQNFNAPKIKANLKQILTTTSLLHGIAYVTDPKYKPTVFMFSVLGVA